MELTADSGLASDADLGLVGKAGSCRKHVLPDVVLEHTELLHVILEHGSDVSDLGPEGGHKKKNAEHTENAADDGAGCRDLSAGHDWGFLDLKARKIQ